MSMPLRVLFIEDSEDDVQLLLRELRAGGFTPVSRQIQSAEDLRAALDNDEWDIVISDYSMPRFTGMQALAIHLDRAPDLPFILVSGTVGEEIAIESIKAGASDYLMKGNLIRFVPAVNRALREAAEHLTHRRAVVSLRESQAMLSLIYNSTSDKLVFFSVLPDESYRIASANQPFLHFADQMRDPTGSSSVIGKRLEEMAETVFHCTPDTIAQLRQRCDAAMRDGKPAMFESTFPLPARRLHCEITLIPVDNSESGGRNLLFACRDISTRKEAQEQQRNLEGQLQQAKKLEALGQLAGGIAHDFNNLLTGILGYGELVKSATGNDPVTHGHVEQILQAADRAKDLVRQILSFSRRETPNRKPTFVEPIVREALQLIRASAPLNINIEVYLMPDMPPILGDATQLHQVLINLCTNAVQAMGEQGKLSISVETVHVDPTLARNHPPLREGDYIRLSVSDTGPGIESALMERLFEPFFTTKPPGSGTGLGLSVVHGIVRGHEGTISVFSRPNEGTTFQVYFPVSGVLPDSQPELNLDLPRGNSEQILFVDDEVAIVNLATALLEQLGYRPVPFTNALDALERFSAQPQSFAAVITDLTMPKMTGTELAQAIHNIRADIPIILTSGYSGAIDNDHTARSGFTEILAKPFARRTLAEALARALHLGGPTRDPADRGPIETT